MKLLNCYIVPKMKREKIESTLKQEFKRISLELKFSFIIQAAQGQGGKFYTQLRIDRNAPLRSFDELYNIWKLQALYNKNVDHGLLYVSWLENKHFWKFFENMRFQKPRKFWICPPLFPREYGNHVLNSTLFPKIWLFWYKFLKNVEAQFTTLLLLTPLNLRLVYNLLHDKCLNFLENFNFSYFWSKIACNQFLMVLNLECTVVNR